MVILSLEKLTIKESIRFYFSSSIFEEAGSKLTIFLSEVRDIFIKVIGVLLFCNSNLLLRYLYHETNKIKCILRILFLSSYRCIY